MSRSGEGNSEPLLALGAIGAIASIISLILVLSDVSLPVPSGIAPNLNKSPSSSPSPRPLNSRAQAQADILAQRYGSQESLLASIRSAESTVESIKSQLSTLQEEQRNYYSERTFAGASRLNRWRSERDQLRQELSTAERELAELRRDYESWLTYSAQLK